MLRFLFRALCLWTVVIVSGCGGGADPAPSTLAVPLKAAKSALPVSGNVISNFGFESGPAGWSEASTGNYGVVGDYQTTTPANTGSQYAWLGGYVSGTDTLSQDLTVPANGTQAKLQFWYQITTEEITASNVYDTLVVEIYNAGTGAKLASLASLSNLDKTTGWVQSPQYDLTAYKGQTVKLKFTAVNDSTGISSFRIDDVAVFALNATAITPQNGWWWNPAEGGRGFAIERQGNQLFMAAFLYETSGAATWYVSTLTQQPDGSYTGAMTRYRGGQTLTGSYVAPATTTTPANASLSFGSATTASLTIQPTDGSAVRTIAIERFPISTPSSFAPSNGAFETGWWWNASQGGRGFFIEVQGSQAFIGSFMYDSAGEPVWYVSTATLQGGQTLSGVLQQYSGGQSLSGSYRSPTTVPGSPGTMAFTFPTSTSANTVLPNGSAVAMTRFSFNATATPSPTPTPTPSYAVAYDTCYRGTPALYNSTYCAAYANAIVAGSTPTAANILGATAAGSNVGNVGTGQVVSTTGTPNNGGAATPCTAPKVSYGGGCVYPAPALSLSKLTLTFPPMDNFTTSATQAVVLTNSGNVGILLGGGDITLPLFAEWRVIGNSCPISTGVVFEPGASCTFGIYFRPIGDDNLRNVYALQQSLGQNPSPIPADNYTGTYIISGNSVSSPQITVPRATVYLNGTGRYPVTCASPLVLQNGSCVSAGTGAATGVDAKSCLVVGLKPAPSYNQYGGARTLTNSCRQKIGIIWCHTASSHPGTASSACGYQGKYFQQTTSLAAGAETDNFYSMPDDATLIYGACMGGQFDIHQTTGGGYTCSKATSF